MYLREMGSCVIWGGAGMGMFRPVYPEHTSQERNLLIKIWRYCAVLQTYLKSSNTIMAKIGLTTFG
jgi:hypothetical protein